MDDLREPLLKQTGRDTDSDANAAVTDYSKARFPSRLFFTWLNPLLGKAIRKSITENDVPILAAQDRATVLFHRLAENLPKQREPHSVRRALLATFWWPLLHTSALAACRQSVLFVGPILIRRFVAVASGNEQFMYERYVLVVVLLLAKTVEAISSHQYNFACAKLGMQIRSALMTTVYRKGLRLSALARQSHGMGPITNHMAGDVQIMADLMLQLNSLWIVPVQVMLGGAVMYPVVGLSSIAGLVVLVSCAWLSYQLTVLLSGYIRVWTQSKDRRMEATVETLASIKIIKLLAWDQKFLEKIENARAPEFRAISGFTYSISMCTFLTWMAPLAATVAIFSCSILFGRALTPSMAFTVVATVRSLQELMRLVPNLLIYGTQAAIVLERLERFLWSEEQMDVVVKLPRGEDLAISIESGAFKWDSDCDTQTLQDINLQIKHGSLVAVVGRVGAGKSSLLAALQGEIPKVAGTVKTSGSTVCVTQSAWIQNATIQDNILFGLPMDKPRYDAACNACALQPDLAQMEFGDQTEIGEQGINLSGGQKQRIQLARALYQDSDIYLLDDIFSAVDAHTGAHLFRECVLGALHGKTVVLVTHQVEFLPRADLILVVKDGEIVQSGQYSDLLMEGTDFEALVGAHSNSMGKVAEHQEKAKDVPTKPESDSVKCGDGVGDSTASDNEGDKCERSGDEAGKLIDDEQRETGKVGLAVYWMYFTKAYGGLLIIPVLITQLVWQLASVAGNYWVAYEASFSAEDNPQAERFILVYGLLALSCCVFVLIQALQVGYFGLVTTQSLFRGMLGSIFRAPMSFFDTTPNGRILSRASADQATLDYALPLVSASLLAMIFQVLGIVAVASQIVWPTVILVLPLSFVYWRCQTYYFATSRELTRLDGITKAPIISQFSETISGLATIRCFRQQDRFIKGNEDRVNSNLRMDFHNNAASEWVGLRMELIAVAFLCASVTILILPASSFLNPDLIGLALAYVLSLNQTLYNTVSMSCFVENRMVAVERIGQYTKLPSEAPLIIKDSRPPPSWPEVGTIVLQNLKLRYRVNTPLVLKGISVTMEGGHKIGVVGRTGSGKSTLILALFRMVEPAEGRILIDDIDIGTLGLTDLRSSLSIIPQEPTLFDGTVRSNLDPLATHADDDIWRALEKCQLASLVRQLEGKLDALVLANGENWSLGQRQLFCLGRVLLKRTRILVLDEATSSVDTETDGLMQQIVRRDFGDCTVVSIAHRIPSVLDSDKVLVLDNGKVTEYAAPSSLLDQPSSLFGSLVREYSSRASN